MLDVNIIIIVILPEAMQARIHGNSIMIQHIAPIPAWLLKNYGFCMYIYIPLQSAIDMAS